MILDAIPDPTKHVVHFHTTRGQGLANGPAALDADGTHFESTRGSIGGRPAVFGDSVPKGHGLQWNTV